MHVPERPEDLERLWLEGEPVEGADVPGWLSPEDALGYRRVAGGDEHSEDVRERLEAAGLVVDSTGVYLADPTTEPVWSIGVMRGDSPLALEPSPGNPVLTRADVSDVPAAYVADPFLLRADGSWHMFFEVFNWRANKGEIGLATSADASTWRYEGIVLAESFHLSYPYVFEEDGERYLVPESFQAGEVRLYRAERFPTSWSPVAVLLRAPYLVDASLFQAAGLWWLFAEASSGDRHDTLRLYLAEQLRGPWTEHPESPVVVGDPAIARPAGRVLVDGDRIVRFAQDCSAAYGTAVRALEVTELTPASFAERAISETPLLAGSGSGWNADGMHHVDLQRDQDGGWIAAVDGRTAAR